MDSRIVISYSLALLMTLVAGAGATPPATSHVEDFSTTDFMDAANTTADWNTGLGVARLQTYPLATVGALNPAGIVLDAVPYGRYAIQAAGSLHVVDLINPGAPVIVGVASLGATAEGVAVAGRYAYVACGSAGIKIVDVGNPTAPVVVGSWGPSVGAHAVAVAGSTLLVADHTSLQVLDVSDPTSPQDAEGYGGTCYDVAVDGHVAYLAAGGNGLVILDVSNQSDVPVLLAQVGLPDDAHGVAVSGGMALVAAGNVGLAMVDVADPASPVRLGYGDVDDTAVDVAVIGDYAYVADESIGLLAFDISDPASPQRLGQIAEQGTASAVATDGRHLLFSDAAAGLKVVETRALLSDPTTGPAWSLPGVGERMAVAGDLALIACQAGGLAIYDVTSPGGTALLATWGSGMNIRSVAVAGGRAYLATDSDGLVVLDITNPASPAFLGSVDDSFGFVDVVVQGDLVYCGTYDDGIRIYDAGDPTAIVQVGTYPIHYTRPVVRIDVDGNWLVAVTSYGNNYVYLLDVQDPATPTVTWISGNFGNYPRDVVVSGMTFYVATGHEIVAFVIDPVTGYASLQGSVPVDDVVDLDLAGDRLLACSAAAVTMYDVTAGSTPVPLDEVAGGATSIAMVGDVLYRTTASSNRFTAMELYQGRYDLENNVVQSEDLDPDFNIVAAVRMDIQQYPVSDWYVRTWAGHQWVAVPYGLDYVQVEPGTELVWRGELVYRGWGVRTSTTQITTEWLLRYGPILGIEDIPGDQGGQVRVRWGQSGYDIAASVDPIHEYAVYRRVEPGKGTAKADGRSYPPGDWDYVTSVPATADATYMTVVPTLADSTITGGQHWSAFFVRALTAAPAVYYNCPVDSGYSVDNLAPNVPQEFVVAYNQPGGVGLAWQESDDADFRYFKVYRGDTSDFDPSSATLVHETTDPQWVDPDGDNGHHYRVSAVDFSGNESAAALPAEVTAVAPDGLPSVWALQPCAPNPFNPATTVHFDVPHDARVRIEILDAAGRRVRTLLDTTVSAGRHDVVWRGRDDGGRAVGSGVYFCRLTGDAFTATRKMMLVQ